VSASDDIKERIVHFYSCSNVPTSEKDWKRVQKFTLNGETVREFHNAKLNRNVFTIGDDEDCGVYERDQWIYGYREDEEGGLAVAFEPQDRWHRTGYSFDQHQQWILEFFHCLPSDKFDEVMENTFIFDDTNPLKLHILLAKYGFKHDQSYTDFLSDDDHPSPGGGTPTPPVNPPLPPALDPQWNPPQVAAPAPGALAAAAAASSNPFNLMAALGAALGPNTNVIGVGPGGTMTPLHGPGGAIAVPPLPPSGMFNSPGMQAAMPLMAGQWPELVNLQPAVQAAFISQRAQGLKGLDQVNPQWMDKAEVEKLLLRHRNMSFDLDIERSNAIWMLYEEADDGSRVLDDYFALDDEELYDELDSWGLLDQMDDEHDVQIVPDYQAYPAPYDLPVPQPQPAPPMPGFPGQQGRPAPMMGPASVNARAGSFAPLPAAPAAVAPPPPPPGNAAAHIRADSGDKWADFCREVWDTYELNKANLPLDIDWYDRYRPRDAQITGLGYRFDRVEFTGIRVLMGYLGRDGELIENIDIPAAVFEDLLKEWGGDWNVDDVTQFINKRKGENPETGFSYSSQTMWEDDIKPFLDSQGWKEAK
jgi:hypothetical protein